MSKLTVFQTISTFTAWLAMLIFQLVVRMCDISHALHFSWLYLFYAAAFSLLLLTCVYQLERATGGSKFKPTPPVCIGIVAISIALLNVAYRLLIIISILVVGQDLFSSTTLPAGLGIDSPNISILVLMQTLRQLTIALLRANLFFLITTILARTQQFIPADKNEDA